MSIILQGDIGRLNTAAALSTGFIPIVQNNLIVKASPSSIVQASGTTGTFTATGNTPVVVANSAVAAGSIIIFTPATVGGTINAAPYINTKSNGVSFTVTTGSTDTSVYNYKII